MPGLLRNDVTSGQKGEDMHITMAKEESITPSFASACAMGLPFDEVCGFFL